MEVKEKIDGLSFLAEGSRKRQSEREKLELYVIVTAITFYAMCVAGVYSNPKHESLLDSVKKIIIYNNPKHECPKTIIKGIFVTVLDWIKKTIKTIITGFLFAVIAFIASLYLRSTNLARKDDKKRAEVAENALISIVEMQGRFPERSISGFWRKHDFYFLEIFLLWITAFVAFYLIGKEFAWT